MKVIYVGNPVLRLVSEEIEVFDAELKDFVQELVKTMYTEDGVGLAAPRLVFPEESLFTMPALEYR